MSDYNDITAIHYRAYRPPIHEILLAKNLSGHFGRGLDVGCGVGHSTIALSDYCHHTIGLEPSSDMLKHAIPKTCVNYLGYDTKEFPFPASYFDIIAFAGSLFYARSQKLLDEILRAGRPQSTVIIYDFEVDLKDVLKNLDLTLQYSGYNHTADFAGLKGANQLIPQEADKYKLQIDVSVPDLSHLILSFTSCYSQLHKRWGEDLENELSRFLDPVKLGVTAYWKRLVITKK